MSISTEKHRDALTREESLRRAEARKRAHYERNKPAILEKGRLIREARDHSAKEAFHRYQRNRLLITRYGITSAEYEEMLVKQGHRCAVCATPNPGPRNVRYFDVDHCHETGKVRGLLCRKCNVTAGVLEKNRERIALIEEYLKAHEPKRSEEAN